MFLKSIATLGLAVTLSFGFAAPSVAQVADDSVDCDDPANEDDPICLGLPADGDPITNFAPIAAPLLGAAALAGLAGSGGTTGTTSTTSTTSTTGGS